MKLLISKDKSNNIVFEADGKEVILPLKQIASFNIEGDNKNHTLVVPLSNGLPIFLPQEDKTNICHVVIGLKEFTKKVSFTKKKVTKIYKYIQFNKIENRSYVAKKLGEYRIKYGPVVAKTIEKYNDLGKVYYKYTETK